MDRLSHGVTGRLTLVSAPAGFGKTTLLASWLGQTSDAGRGVAWLSLDAVRPRPRRRSGRAWSPPCSSAVPGVGDAGAGAADGRTRLDRPALTALLNDLAEVPDEVWLVLDDYHLSTDQDIAVGA